ncbi:MAG: hypothetical protein WBK76_00395 [Candidatus Saccharimonadales bacterium]
MKTIWDIQRELGLEKCEDGSYTGTYTTGQFDQLHDYDCGLLQVKIGVVNIRNTRRVLFSISTIDDGVWQAWDAKTDYTKEEAQQRVEEIANTFSQRMNGSLKLPTEKVLNEWLSHIKLWGEYTG